MEPRTIEAPVDEVVLLEDRAHVYRRARLELEAGRHRLVIEGVAPVIADKTLVGAIEEGAGVVLAGTTIRREMVFRDLDTDDSALGALERERREMDLAIQRTNHELEMLDTHAHALDRLAALTYGDVAVDAAWGRVVDDTWRERLGALRLRERDLRVRGAELGSELRRLGETRSRLQARIARLENPAAADSARIEIDLEVEAATAITLRVDYVVPGACWRPRHTAELLAVEPPRVRFTTEACVWQNTGEDWNHVQLELSTERASLGSEPPRLETDRLRYKKKSETVVVEARQQAIDTAGLGRRTQAAAELPGIDDGGDALNLRAAERVDVPSDGRPYRAPLSVFDSDAELSLVAYPELSPCVFTRTELCNAGAAPILAGPVELIRASGPVGRTQVLYIAPDERFELGWGPDAELRVHRTARVKDATSRLLSSWVSRGHEVEVTLSNLGTSARRVEVAERVPVSEIDKVKIELDLDETTDRAAPDRDGISRWTVELPPRGHHRLQLRYTVKKHEDVAGI